MRFFRSIIPVSLFPIFYLFLCQPILAQEDDGVTINEEEIEFPEPISIEEVHPNAPGVYDLLLRFEQWQLDETGENFSLYNIPHAQLFFGITNRLSGEIEYGYISRSSDQELASGREVTSGFGNLGISSKYSLFKNEEKQMEFVLGMEVEFPTGSKKKELGEGKYEFEPYVAFFKAFRTSGSLIEHLFLQGNVGYAVALKGETEKAPFYNFALGIPYKNGKKLNLFLESVGYLTDERNEIYFSPGLKYALKEELYLAISYPIDLIESGRTNFIFQFQVGF